MAYWVGRRDPRQLLIMVHDQDGRLEASWLGDELPGHVTAKNGDFVSYAYVTDQENLDVPLQRVESYRVRPDVFRIEHGAFMKDEGPSPDCNLLSMPVRVNVIGDVAGEQHVIVSGPMGGGFADVYPSRAANIDVNMCDDGQSPFRIFARAYDGSDRLLALAMSEEIRFQHGVPVEVTVSLATPLPRSPLTIEVDDLDGAIESSGWGWWEGYDRADWRRGYAFSVDDGMQEATYVGAAPFTYTASLFDIPVGAVVGGVFVTLTPPEAPCSRYADLMRVGKRDAPIPFHVNALADVVLVGPQGWALQGSGTTGDEVRLSFRSGQTDLVFHEDPRETAHVATLPSFPERLPVGFVVPDAAEPVTYPRVQHIDIEDLPSYGALVASSRPPASHTTRRRGQSGECAAP